MALLVVRQAAAVRNQTAQRLVPVVARVEGDARALAEAAQEDALRRDSLRDLLVDERIDLFHALLHSRALVVSSVVPRGEIKLGMRNTSETNPGVMLCAVSAGDFHEARRGAHEARSAEGQGEVCGKRGHEEA